MTDQLHVVFAGPSGTLRLGVEGYQFPNIADDEWDSNWLFVVGEAVVDGKPWRFRDPCLTTFEVNYLADWLDKNAAGNATKDFLGFTEPNLDFERRSGEFIRIGFSLESKPPWADPESDFGEVGFDVPVDDQLRIVACGLREWLAQYPVRARAP